VNYKVNRASMYSLTKNQYVELLM